MNKQKFVVATITIFLSCICSAKTASFTWQNELCEYKGIYDSNKFTAKQLKDTLQMIRQKNVAQLNSKSYAFQPNQIAEIDLQAISKEYKITKQNLNSLEPIPLQEFKQLKQNLLKELDQEYQHNYLTAISFTQPEKLLIKTYGQQCLAIAQSLNTQDKAILLNNAKLSLQRENKQQLKLGNDPQFLAKRTQDFNAKLQSANAVQYAQIQLIRDWTNCANPHESTTNQLEQVFRKKVFIQSKEVYCDEP